MFKKYYIKALNQLQQSAILAVIYNLIFEVLPKTLIKPSAVIKDDNRTADVYNIGKKDNPKGVVITNKQFKADYKPLIFFAITTLITSLLLGNAQKKKD